MIHKVEHLRLELNANTFSHRKPFLARKIGIVLPDSSAKLIAFTLVS